MESTEFDATLGGAEYLPYSANSLKFAASRSIEIAAMTESILRPSKTKLIFQSLPVHMRRRVMSHNCKRLPRKLREGHLEQLKKSGLPPKQKRPSRKYRRRPANLLAEYNRRQKQVKWLETHIWHAKRFHMIKRWGHRLAYAPCDKAFRACYRASSAHCLMQDISYYTPIQIKGSIEGIKELFSTITNISCGLSICAKAFTNGNREGMIHLYKSNMFPLGYVGRVHFIWVPNDSSNKALWLFVHPSQLSEVESLLVNIVEEEDKIPEKRRKLTNHISEKIQVTILRGIFNRFRLTGPNSHAVLTRSLTCVCELETIKNNAWVSSLQEKSLLYLKEKHEYWQKISLASSPSQLPAKVVIGLVVRDPRLNRPQKRMKAEAENLCQVDVKSLISTPEYGPISPLWDPTVHKSIKGERLTNGQFIEHVTKTQLVPGEVNKNDPKLQSVPIVLIQRPGSQDSQFKKVGYGSGWDVIVPSGYGLFFWQTFIMFGGRSGGLRETESLAFEMGESYLPPDSNAGKVEEKRIETEMREKYFRLPPSKRVNYIKLGIKSPFICPWSNLLGDWSHNVAQNFFVLRDKKQLITIQECITKRLTLPQIEKVENCLVGVYIEVSGKGNLKRHALICAPQPGDIAAIKTLFEPHHADANEKLRKQKKDEHIRNIKRWRRKRIKLKKKSTDKIIVSRKKVEKKPSEYVKTMRELWLPSEINSIRKSTTREIIGFISQGAFSFSEAKSCGVGYVAYNAFKTLLEAGHSQVLIRNNSSRKYRLANIHVIKDT